MLEGAKQEGTSDVVYSRNQPSVLEDDRGPQRQRGARSGAQHTSYPKRITDFRGSGVRLPPAPGAPHERRAGGHAVPALSQNWIGFNGAFWRAPNLPRAPDIPAVTAWGCGVMSAVGGDRIAMQVSRDWDCAVVAGVCPADEKTGGRVCGFAETAVETDSRQSTPKHQGKPGIIRGQRTRPVNKIDNFTKSAKPTSPVQIRAAPPTFAGPFRPHGERIIPETWVTPLDRMGSRSVRSEHG